MRTDELHASAVLYARLKEELATAYGLDADDECLDDTLEGASDLQEIIIRALREAQISIAMANAIDTVLDAAMARQKRLTDKSLKIRAAVAKAMQEAGLPKIMAPDMTISQRIPRPSPKIIDPAELPKWATKTTTTTKPDLAAIKQAFEEDPAGFSCAGVIIPNVEPVLTVRSK